MNRLQKILAIGCIPVVMTVLLLDRFFPGATAVVYFKFLVMVSLGVVAFRVHDKSHDQKLMALAVFFMVVSDVFLVVGYTLPMDAERLEPLGAAGFAIAYVFLIAAYRHNVSAD